MATPDQIDHIRREGVGNAWIVARIQRQNDLILNASLPGVAGEPYDPWRLSPQATPQEYKNDIAAYAEARVRGYVAYLQRTSEPGVTVAYNGIKPIAMSDEEKARWGARMTQEMAYGNPTQQPPLPQFSGGQRYLWGAMVAQQQHTQA